MSTQWYGVICVETDETTGKITATLDDQNPNHYNHHYVYHLLLIHLKCLMQHSIK